MPHPETTQPISNPHERAHKEPPNHDERDANDQQNSGNDPPEAPAPQVVALIAYVSRVDQDYKRAEEFVPIVKREGFLEPLSLTCMTEGVDLCASLQRLFDACA
jgi:hypothetical protein